MTKRRPSPKRLTLLSFLGFIIVLGMQFLGQTKSALEGFDRWVGHEDHRLPNVRQVPTSCRWAVIDRFIDLQPVGEADAFIFGDSQMFARGATQEELFYTHWLGTDATVLNFSFLEGHIWDMGKIANELHRRDISSPVLLHNMNISHFPKNRDSVLSGAVKQPSTVKRAHLPERPMQFGKLYQNRLVCAFRMRKTLTKDSLRTPRYRKLLTKFNYVSLPKFSVDFDRQYFNASVTEYVESFENISEHPIFITAPMAHDELGHYGFDASKLNEFSLALQALCDERPKLECHDLTRVMTREGFMDIIHMNATGHKLLGQELKLITTKN